MSDQYNRDELEKQMYQKNLETLQADDGLIKLLSYNLENFAYRYIETSVSKNISAMVTGKTVWVESLEPDVIQLLKTAGPELKAKLIDVCKEYPGPEAKKIQVEQKIGTTIEREGKVVCFAKICWDFPSFTDTKKSIYKEEVFEYDDPILLRNKHAAILERVCEIFQS